MPRKKRTVAPEPVVSEKPELLALTQEEVLRLRLFDMEAKLATQEAISLAHERRSFLSKIDPEGRISALDEQRVRCVEREQTARLSYRQALDSASKRLGMDLSSGCAIDPETGTVVVLDKKKE